MLRSIEPNSETTFATEGTVQVDDDSQQTVENPVDGLEIVDHMEWHDFVNRQRYDAPADPWTVIRVEPAAVEYLKVIRVFWGPGESAVGSGIGPST